MSATATLDVSPSVQVETIPQELRALPQWTFWRFEANPKGGKDKKAPRNPHTGQNASPIDPQDWGTLDDAIDAVERFRGNGVQFLLSKTDPYAGIDLDHCVAPDTGEVEPWAAQIVAGFDAYTEISPSGTGLRIITQGKKPEGAPSHCGPIEVYDRAKALTITGNLQRKGRIRDGQTQVEWLCLTMKPLAKALAATHGKKVSLLFAGRWEEVTDQKGAAYPSQNEADLAFCRYLALAAASAEEIDAAMRVSGLYRDKWEREDYRTATIEKAIEAHMKEAGQRGQGGAGLTRGASSKLTRSRATALLMELGYADRLWFNSWRQRAYLDDQELSDRHYREIAAAMDEVTGEPWPKERVWEAMESQADANRRDPMVDWLEALKWDNTDWLKEFFRLFRLTDPFDQLLWRKTLIAMVARALEPGCKVDTVLILQDPQGTKKSSLIEALCPDRTYFVEDCAILKGKDELMKLQDAWAVEVKELAALQARTVEELKAFFSQLSDRYRTPYGRRDADHPRHCVFFGTTNKAEFLQDETGSRRFWVVKMGFQEGEEMPIEWVKAHRNDLFAQVVVLYHQGEPWWLNPTEAAALSERNREFEEEDAWDSVMMEWARTHHHFTTADVLRGPLSLERDKWSPANKTRVTRILRRHRFWSTSYRKVRCWSNPDPEVRGEEGQESVGDEVERWANQKPRKLIKPKA